MERRIGGGFRSRRQRSLARFPPGSRPVLAQFNRGTGWDLVTACDKRRSGIPEEPGSRGFAGQLGETHLNLHFKQGGETG